MQYDSCTISDLKIKETDLECLYNLSCQTYTLNTSKAIDYIRIHFKKMITLFFPIVDTYLLFPIVLMCNHRLNKIFERKIVHFYLPISSNSVVPRSSFLGDTSVPLPEFQRDICKFWGTHRIHLFFTCKIENSFPEISVHFYLNLSSMLVVLAQEVVEK